MFRSFIKFLSVLSLSLLVFIPAPGQNLTNNSAAKLLPDRLGEFKATDTAGSAESLDEESQRRFGLTSWAARHYISKDGKHFQVLVNTTDSESGAYAEFTERRRLETSGSPEVSNDAGVGTASFSYSDGKRNHLCFFKGLISACVQEKGGDSPDIQLLTNLGKALAATVDKGEDAIPVLVKHLPDWQRASSTAYYAVSVETLKRQFGSESVFDVISFEGGAESVIGQYGSQQLVIIEFNTPQVATDQNRKIVARIQELRNQAQRIPSAYRRVGNYAVFVFDAPSEQAANQLIDQVKYQQVVQWLGENPFSYEQATREFTETTLGVFVSVVKASGLALVACFAVGGVFGALLFNLRRSQQRAKEAYSDSDAMIRLNLDELTPESDPARLLGRGN